MTGEALAFGDEARAEPEAARRRLDQQHAQLRHALDRLVARCIARLHEEHAADRRAVALGDPASLVLRVEAID